MASINKTEVEAVLANLQTLGTEEYDLTLEHEVQTDKDAVKLVPCRECLRPLVVTTFFAAAKARCRVCAGETDSAVASVGVPIPGSTDPSKAVDLHKVLINPEFANALCPVHPNDPEHEMELKHVNQNEHYGPSKLIGYDARGRPEYRQEAPGETVLHQCLKCKATVTYSTTAQSQFKRINEVRPGKHLQGTEASLGSREELAVV